MTAPVIHQPSERFWTLYPGVSGRLNLSDCIHILDALRTLDEPAVDQPATADEREQAEQQADADWLNLDDAHTATYGEAIADPRTLAQIDADIEAAEWEATYQTLLP